MSSIESLKTVFDEVEETNGEDEFKKWLNVSFDAKIEIAKFVEAHRGHGKVTEYVGFHKGSFNFSFRYRFDEGPDTIIRFPKPGFTATTLRDEKVANEVQVLEYIRQKTTIPVPHIYHWGLTKDSPLQLGPFIIMDFVEGKLLSTILKKPTEDDQEDPVLNPNIEDSTLDVVYHQIAGYLLQLSQCSFSRIGAISKDEASEWVVRKRPLTYNMNELVTVSGYSMDRLPNSTFKNTNEYFDAVSQEHLHHLCVQRNLANDEATARARFVARHGFTRLIHKYCIPDTGTFLLYCDDLRPSNMLVNPDTLQITAVIDWEFTNAMPPQFSMDPPWWLLVSGPEVWLDRGALDEFNNLYERRLEQFLRVMEAEERKVEYRGQKRLSKLMRDSWRSGRFWFDYAARKSFEVDAVYWATLHANSGDGRSLAGLVEEEDTDMRLFVEHKMSQLKAYEEECKARFS